MMTRLLKTFLNKEQAQDVIEYTLCLAFVVITVAGLVVELGTSSEGIWKLTEDNLSSAEQVAGGSSRNSDGY